MDRFSLLQSLESRYIPIETYRITGGELFASLDWRKVEYGCVATQFANVRLDQYSDEGLAELLRESMSQLEYEAMVVRQQKEYQKVAG